jgi:hypothetical protein
VHKRGLPRLFRVEEEYRDRLRAAEIDYVRFLIRDIESGTLDGADWWRQVHERGFDQVPRPSILATCASQESDSSPGSGRPGGRGTGTRRAR